MQYTALDNNSWHIVKSVVDLFVGIHVLVFYNQNLLVSTRSVYCNEVLEVVLLHLVTILLVFLGMFNFWCGHLAANLMVLGQSCFPKQ